MAQYYVAQKTSKNQWKILAGPTDSREKAEADKQFHGDRTTKRVFVVQLEMREEPLT